MKCLANFQLNFNKNLLLFFILLQLLSCKSFIDLAQEEVFKKEDYESEKYRKEAASLNPQYYTLKGQIELGKCRDLYNANYDRCSRFQTCNFCAANPDCGWCNEKKLCIPIDLNSRNDQMEPLCQGDCIRVLKIEYCYKVLFEPENTQEEVNFANYPEVLNNEDQFDTDNIFERALEKNFYESRKQSMTGGHILNPLKYNFNFKQQENSSPYSNFSFKEKNKNNPSYTTADLPAHNDLSDNLKFTPNHHSLNYIPNASTNKPLSVNLDAHHERLEEQIKNISKQVFSDLVDKKIDKSPPPSLLKINYKSDKEKKEDMMQALKEFIPNFEFPQYLNSDLESSIEKIKKEKLLLWLRGYSMNEPLSKHHLPIYKNLKFVNEDQARKMFLDKFYKDIVRDPYQKLNSQVYKNLIGEQTLTGEDIPKNFIGRMQKQVYFTARREKVDNDDDSNGNFDNHNAKRNKVLEDRQSKAKDDDFTEETEKNIKGEIFNVKNKKKEFVVPVTRIKAGEDVNLVKRENTNSTNLRKTERISPSPPKKDEFAGKTPLEVIKSLKVINSKYIDKNDLLKLVRGSNMRFKQQNKKSSISQSLKEISNELKNFLKHMK